MPTVPASAEQQRLRALVTRLNQLTGLQAAQRNQRRLVSDATVLETFQQILTLLASQIRTLEARIAELISQDPLWRKLDAAFPSPKGVADLVQLNANGRDVRAQLPIVLSP